MSITYMSEIYTIGSQPYYNNLAKCYTHIYTIDRMPLLPLANIVRRVNNPKLSPFQTSSDCCSTYNNNCILALFNPTSLQELLRPGQEAILFSYLVSNGYTIDTSLTKILKNAPVQNGSRLLCTISK